MNRRPDDRDEREITELLCRVEGPVPVPERTRRDVLLRMSAAYDDALDRRPDDGSDEVIELTPSRSVPESRRPYAMVGLVAALVLLVIGGAFLVVLIDAEDSTGPTSVTSPVTSARVQPSSHHGGPFRLDAGSSWVYEVTTAGELTGTWRVDRISESVETIRMTWSPEDASPSEFEGTLAPAGGSTPVPVAALLVNLTPPDCRDVVSIGLRATDEFERAVQLDAQCADEHLIAVGTTAWRGTEFVTTPAGSFEARRVDIELDGFEPFPLTVTMWFDAGVGLVAQQLTKDDGTVLTRLELVDVADT
jgi:hypothetical protein